MLSSSPSSGPLVLQSRSHYLQRSTQNTRRSDILKDVDQLTDIDLDAWTALGIQGVVLDLALFRSLSASEQQDWVKAVQSIGITIFGLDRAESPTESALGHALEFPVVRLNDRLLLTILKDTVVCLSPQADRVVFLGRTWSDRVVSWVLGCRFTAVQASTELVYQRERLLDPQA